MEVVKNIPAPEAVRGRPSKYPFGSLDVGDSLFADGQDGVRLRMAAAQYRYNHPGFNFSARRDGSGIRVWRTA